MGIAARQIKDPIETSVTRERIQAQKGRKGKRMRKKF
jgi:hypothetical protein